MLEKVTDLWYNLLITWGCNGIDRIEDLETASRWQSLNAHQLNITGNNYQMAYAA